MGTYFYEKHISEYITIPYNIFLELCSRGDDFSDRIIVHGSEDYISLEPYIDDVIRGEAGKLLFFITLNQLESVEEIAAVIHNAEIMDMAYMGDDHITRVVNVKIAVWYKICIELPDKQANLLKLKNPSMFKHLRKSNSYDQNEYKNSSNHSL